MEERMKDVKKRYGFYPQAKWDTNIRLMQHFEKKMNQNIYIVCEKDTFVPEGHLMDIPKIAIAILYGL